MSAKCFTTGLIFYWIFLIPIAFSRDRRPTIDISCNCSSDLCVLLRKEKVNLRIYRTPNEAIASATKGTGVLILSDSYPVQRTSVSMRLLNLAKKKQLKLYVEYPSFIPGLAMSDTVVLTRFERAVVTSAVFGKNLKPMSILGINDCHIIPVKAKEPLIVMGRVAGFDRAVYGISGIKTYPLLLRKGNMLVAMSRLSSFATGRYEPSESWKVVWQYILSWVSGNSNFVLHHWLSYVCPMYGKTQSLPSNAIRTSIQKGTQWFFGGHFLVDSSWEKACVKYQGNGVSPVGPPLDFTCTNGNGSLGIIEGQTSYIYYDGDQQYRYWIRSDNQGQVAYALAAAGDFLQEKSYYKIASNLGDFIFYYSNLRSGHRNDKKSPAFGLIGWAVTHPGVFYEDDNARLLLGLIGAEAYMKTDRWDKEIAEGILANFRTSGQKGFRGSWISQDALLKNGWKHFWDLNVVDPHPHYEAWMWACYLWLYSKTHYEPLLAKTEDAIRITMEDYPGQWVWSNGFQQERARMILPLAWLVRVDDTPQHRRWLDKVVSDMLKYQAPCGAIREELGPPSRGQYGPPKSNHAYGSTEAPLIFKNGEPVADMLYTNNFAFFSLNEAAHVTKDKRYMEAVKKLANFLIRIQVRSSKHKDLDGAWFRAFDYGLWDYWASNGDAGWGAWSTNTGWIQSWIISTEVLVKRNESFWDLTKGSRIGNVMPEIIKVMFGGSAD